MKKGLILVLILMLFCVPAFAQRRGPLQNIFASWYTVTTSQTITFPYNSRDLTIHNASAIDIVVDVRGNTIDTDFINDGSATTFQLQGDEILTLRDYITDSISLMSAGASASPISVIATY